VVVPTFEKFRPDLIGSHIIVFISHVALKHLVEKKDAKARLIRWIMLLQKCDCEIRDRKDSKNLVADHLSKIATSDACESLICECSADERLFGAHVEPGLLI